MNITVITPIFPPDIGGPATYTFEVSRRLSERGHHIKIGALTPSAKGPNVHIIHRKRLKFPAVLYTYLVSFIKILKIIKGCNLVYDQNPSLLGLASLLAARLLRKPVAIRFAGVTAWEEVFNQRRTEKHLEAFLRSPEGGIRTKLMLQLQRFILNKVDKVIVPSHFLKDVLTNYYRVKPTKIRVIYNSIDLKDCEVTSLERRRTPESPILITIGRLTCHKRIDRVIRVVKEIIEEYPRVSLQIVGDGPEKGNLQTLSQKLNVKGQVQFQGQLSRQETIARLRQSDIFILNSVYEGFPHTVIEAMACRTPVIATNIRGTNEAVKDGETGLLVEADNDIELKEKIALLLKDRELRVRLADKAYESVEQGFTWEKNLDLLERELEAMV